MKKGLPILRAFLIEVNLHVYPTLSIMFFILGKNVTVFPFQENKEGIVPGKIRF